MAHTKYGKTAYKNSKSKTGGHVHGRISFPAHLSKERSTRLSEGSKLHGAVVSSRRVIKYTPHTETSTRLIVRSKLTGRKIKLRESAHSTYVGRKVRRRG